MQMAKSTKAKQYNFYTSAEYWPELLSCIKQAQSGERIALITMDFDPTDPTIKGIMQALQQACERGVNVWLSVDARPLIFDPSTQRLGPLWRSNRLVKVGMSALSKERLGAIEAINAQPTGQAAIINKPTHRFSNPFAGRSHIKFSLINDKIFIGSCNLDNDQALNVMVGWEDKQTADYLFKFIRDVLAKENVGRMLGWQDQKLQLSLTDSLLIDAGKRKQSIILEQALQLIDETKETITITCQFFPNSLTAQHLLAAHNRGVQVSVFFAHPSRHKGFYGLGQSYNVWREKQRLPEELFRLGLGRDVPLLHAKLLITDAGTMIGSHNFVRAGVVLGTAEIALLCRGPAFAEAALVALERELP